MHRGRLVVGVLGAACLIGCEWFAGIEDLSLAPDEGGLTRRDGGNADEYTSADAEKEGSEAGDDEPAESAAPDVREMLPMDAGNDVEPDASADSAGLSDSASPDDSAGSDSAGPADSGGLEGAAVDAPADSASCACGPQSVCVGVSCITARRVFVTNETYDGALGGHAGADATCQMLATGAALGGSWMAWISDSTSSPSQRFSMPTVGYYLLDGTPIAASWTDLTKNGPTHAIDVTETRASLATASIDGSKTWTATLTTGVLGTPSCSNFASNASAVEGGVGHCTGTGTVNWTSAYTTETCDITNRLYCFEQ